jgi:hypothetical protein
MPNEKDRQTVNAMVGSGVLNAIDKFLSLGRRERQVRQSFENERELEGLKQAGKAQIERLQTAGKVQLKQIEETAATTRKLHDVSSKGIIEGEKEKGRDIRDIRKQDTTQRGQDLTYDASRYRTDAMYQRNAIMKEKHDKSFNNLNTEVRHLNNLSTTIDRTKRRITELTEKKRVEDEQIKKYLKAKADNMNNWIGLGGDEAQVAEAERQIEQSQEAVREYEALLNSEMSALKSQQEQYQGQSVKVAQSMDDYNTAAKLTEMFQDQADIELAGKQGIDQQEIDQMILDNDEPLVRANFEEGTLDVDDPHFQETEIGDEFKIIDENGNVETYIKISDDEAEPK